MELGKSHHEVICSLLYMQLCLDDANETNRAQFKQNAKQFYFHAGCLLDNLARLIYILCDPNSDTKDKTYKVWPPTRSGRVPTATTVTVRQRRYIDWGSLRGSWNNHNFADYRYWLIKSRIDEIINLRNCLTHSWQPPMLQNAAGVTEWPNAVRTRRDFLWPFDTSEGSRMRKHYRKWISITDMMQDDLKFLEETQSRIFSRLRVSFGKFERRHNFSIL
ncbi:MAG: hypothetical protein Q8T09_19610 [Candidatus Melainabacteria bacterium]|nr:hypothetical protein [Candidatus Melainabacteria bacterium]